MQSIFLYNIAPNFIPRKRGIKYDLSDISTTVSSNLTSYLVKLWALREVVYIYRNPNKSFLLPNLLQRTIKILVYFIIITCGVYYILPNLCHFFVFIQRQNFIKTFKAINNMLPANLHTVCYNSKQNIKSSISLGQSNTDLIFFILSTFSHFIKYKIFKK